MTDTPTPVPEDQLPGHHPDVEQDKPAPTRLPPGTERRFAFAFDPVNLALGAPFGVTPWTSEVRVTSTDLIVRYGPWTLRTPLANVARTATTGPYDLVRIAGPPRVSLADRGISFATRREGGLCIRFHEAVPAVLPLHLGLIRHPAATVTVEGAGELAKLLEGLGTSSNAGVWTGRTTLKCRRSSVATVRSPKRSAVATTDASTVPRRRS